MNKYIWLIASCFMVLGSAYTLPIAFRFPTASNLLVSGLITAVAVLGLVMFFRGNKARKPRAIDGFTPVRD